MKGNFKHKLLAGATMATLLFGGLGTAAFASQSQTLQQQPVQQSGGEETGQDERQEPQYTGSIRVDQQSVDGMSEADEAAALQAKATITAAEAEAAALAANPGAKIVKSELDNENGVLVYSVELDNGADVKVDAGNGAVLYTDQGEDGAEIDEATHEESDANDADNIQDEHEDADQDNLQEEHDGQPDDGSETPGVEDAAGQ